MPSATGQVRKRPALLRALGRREPPDAVVVCERPHRLERVLKHDLWAATAIYRDAEGGRIIAKFGRVQPAFGVPLGWVGRAMAAREVRFLRRLDHLDAVPKDLGPVTADGRRLRNAIARAYVPGEPFTDDSRVGAAFFVDLRGLLDALHATGMAYVDLHKRENIVIDPAGRPHLVDFQVSFAAGAGWRGALARPILRRLQEMDDYHWRKHYARCLPETLSDAERARYLTPPGFVRSHRRIAAPLRQLRRRLLVWLKVRDHTGEARSELEPEDAFRRPTPD